MTGRSAVVREKLNLSGSSFERPKKLASERGTGPELGTESFKRPAIDRISEQQSLQRQNRVPSTLATAFEDPNLMQAAVSPAGNMVIVRKNSLSVFSQKDS